MLKELQAELPCHLFIRGGVFAVAVKNEKVVGGRVAVILRGLWEWQGLMRQSLSLAADRVKRILTLMKSQNVAINNKK